MSINGIFRVHGGGKTTVAFPYKPVELQLAVPLPVGAARVGDSGIGFCCRSVGRLFCIANSEDSKAAVGFTAGTQRAAGIDSRNAAETFDTLNMRMPVYGDGAAEAFSCHAQFTPVKLNMVQMSVRQ